MLKIIKSFMIIAVISIFAVVAARAYFSDSETSDGNTFSSGTLDLNVDGDNTNVVKFNIVNLIPGDQGGAVYRLKNVGSIPGYLDFHDIVVTNQENGLLDPETEAGDITPGTGELQDLMSYSLFRDYDCNGNFASYMGDYYIYGVFEVSTPLGLILPDYDLNIPLAAGEEICVASQYKWYSNGALDDRGQSDSAELDMTFELGQTTGQ